MLDKIVEKKVIGIKQCLKFIKLGKGKVLYVANDADARLISPLIELAEKENIKILHCVESGSRAWGFASPDSDYDVRFIYVRPKEFYLRLDKTREVIEWQLDDTLDINGWDVSKAYPGSFS